MMDNNTESFDKIVEYEEKIHKKNQNRIKYGIRLIIIIPMIFLFVMFKLESSKVVFLVLWIVSLFGIAAYLISVEYMDYQLQIKLSEFGIREDKPIEGLLKEESKVEQIIVNAGLLDDNRESRLKAIAQKYNSSTVAQIEEKAIDENSTDSDKLDAILQAQKAMEEENRKLRDKLEAMEKAVQGISSETMGKQAEQSVAMEKVHKKSAQDYAAMRKARALEKHENDKE